LEDRNPDIPGTLVSKTDVMTFATAKLVVSRATDGCGGSLDPTHGQDE
jgi:hypothetical protein